MFFDRFFQLPAPTRFQVFRPVEEVRRRMAKACRVSWDERLKDFFRAGAANQCRGFLLQEETAEEMLLTPRIGGRNSMCPRLRLHFEEGVANSESIVTAEFVPPAGHGLMAGFLTIWFGVQWLILAMALASAESWCKKVTVLGFIVSMHLGGGLVLLLMRVAAKAQARAMLEVLDTILYSFEQTKEENDPAAEL